MNTSTIAHWTWNPPAWGLALSQDRPAAGRKSDPVARIAEKILAQCVDPALAATGAREFLAEVGRKLPLFVALQVKLLEELASGSMAEVEPPSVPEKYEAFADSVRRWSQRLDDVTRAELDFALGTLLRGNRILLQNPRRAQDPQGPGFAELFRATSLADFLFSCLWRLIESDQRPEILEQIVYSLRYAVLDYAAAVRRLLEPAASPTAPLTVAGDDPEEDAFWATVGALPLFELAEPA